MERSPSYLQRSWLHLQLTEKLFDVDVTLACSLIAYEEGAEIFMVEIVWDVARERQAGEQESACAWGQSSYKE